MTARHQPIRTADNRLRENKDGCIIMLALEWPERWVNIGLSLVLHYICRYVHMYVSLAHKSVFWPRAFVKSLPDLLWNHRITDCSSIYNQCLSWHNASLSSNRCIMICCSVRLIALTMHSTAIFKQLTSESIQYRGSASRSLFPIPIPNGSGQLSAN